MQPATKRQTFGTIALPLRAYLLDTIAAGRRSAVPKPEAAVANQDWAAHLAREEARYRDGEARLPEPAPDDPSDPESRQRQLTRMGNAAGGAALALLMEGRRAEAAEWFVRAAGRYRESFAEAPPGSWGRPIGAIKALVLADDWARAEEAAAWALEAGAAESDSPIGGYAAALALLVLGRDAEARVHGRRDPDPRRLPTRRRRRARVHRRKRHPRLRNRDRVGARFVRVAGRVPRGHTCRRHRACPPGARRPARHGRGVELAPASQEGLTKHRLSRRAALLAPMPRPQSRTSLPGTHAPCVLASERASPPATSDVPPNPPS